MQQLEQERAIAKKDKLLGKHMAKELNLQEHSIDKSKEEVGEVKRDHFSKEGLQITRT